MTSGDSPAPGYPGITYVIPCGAAKLGHPARVQNLYTGSMFRHTWENALRSAAMDEVAGLGPARVLVLSAKHGLVEPDQVLHPYDLRMGQPGSVSAQIIAQQALALGIDWGSEVYALLPRPYLARLDEALRTLDVYVQDVYEATKGIGEQKQVNVHIGRPSVQPGVSDGPGPTVWLRGDVIVMGDAAIAVIADDSSKEPSPGRSTGPVEADLHHSSCPRKEPMPMPMPYNHIIDAAEARATGSIDAFTVAYISDGGTWILASNAKTTDDDRPHDLLAVLPMPLEDTRVLVLRPTVNPELVAALREALDPRSAQEPGGHRITLDFENAETLCQALEHIGKSDAPMTISSGSAVSGGTPYTLWDEFDAAVAAAAEAACEQEA